MPASWYATLLLPSVIDVQSALTIVETPTFAAEAARLWSEDERLEFFSWIANEPEAGAVIRGSGGCRKLRWARQGSGQSGGARVTVVEPNEVAQARQITGLSQAQFAEALHISKRTLQEWEQGRRSPSGAAKALIEIAKKHPEVVREALAA